MLAGLQVQEVITMAWIQLPVAPKLVLYLYLTLDPLTLLLTCYLLFLMKLFNTNNIDIIKNCHQFLLLNCQIVFEPI